MKTIFVLITLAFISVLPLIVERTPSHCQALERLAMHKILETKNPKLKLDPATEKRVRGYFKQGGVVEVIIRRNYTLSTGWGCPLMYWQGLFDDEALRAPVLAMQ